MPRGVARDHADKRAALRQGAAVYFAQHGFDRASMAGAARACGVSKALMYHYHDSKEALLYDILHSHLVHLVEVAERAAKQGVRALIAALLESYEHADAQHKLQLEALSALPTALQGPLRMLQGRLVKIMAQTLRPLRPDLGNDRLRAGVMTVFGIINWVYLWHRPQKGLSRADYAALAADFVEGGIARI